MRVYVDSSALLKRVITEQGSDDLDAMLAAHASDGSALICSSLGWVEVSRALRGRVDDDRRLNDWCDVALSGILERPIDGAVVALARRIAPPVLRSLDAVHLATAVLTDVDAVIAYDQRLLDAVRHHGLSTVSPGV